MKAHVGTLMEATRSLLSQYKAIVGQSWVRLLMSALCFTSLVALAVYSGAR